MPDLHKLWIVAHTMNDRSQERGVNQSVSTSGGPMGKKTTTSAIGEYGLDEKEYKAFLELTRKESADQAKDLASRGANATS